LVKPMRFKRTPISKMSAKGKLRKEMGKLHLALLVRKRGPNCEICGLPGAEGRFHILPVGQHPRLEFVDANVLLVHWMRNCQAHFQWHHAGPADRRNIRTLNRIKQIRGDNYEEELRATELCMPKHDGLFLLALKQTMQKELDR